MARKQLEWEAEKAMQTQDYKELTYRKTYDFIIYTFNKQKVDAIELRLKLLDELLAVGTRMFYLKFVQWEHVLDVMSKKTETELFLKNYETYLSAVQLDDSLRSQDLGALPIFDLLFDVIENIGVDTTANRAALDHRIAAIEHEFHWTKDMSLSAQLRYNHYQGGDDASYSGRDFVAAGLSFGIPIPFKKSTKDELKSAKIEQLEVDYRTFQHGLNNELLNHYYEYEYALKQYVNFFYKKERLAVLIDRGLRKKRLDDPDYSPLEVVDRLDELFSVDLELLDIQQKMYLKALKIFTMISTDHITDFIEVKDYNQFASQTPGGRSIYCDAEQLADMEAKYLVEFLKYNGADEVLVSIDGNPDLYLRYAALLDALKGTSLGVRLNYKPVSIHALAMADLEESMTFALTPKIHIDFSDFDLSVDDQIMLTAFLERNYQSFDISISLSASQNKDFRTSIYSYVTYVNLVPDQSEQLMSFFHDLEEDRWNGVNKSRLVVLPRDFDSRMDLDNFIKLLLDHLEIDAVGLLDVQSLIDLDKKTITWHEERGF